MPEQRLRELIDLQIPQPLYHSYVQLRFLLHTMSYMDSTRAAHQVIWDPLHHTNNYSGWVTPQKKIDPTTSWSQQPASQRKIYCIAINIKYAIELLSPKTLGPSL